MTLREFVEQNPPLWSAGPAEQALAIAWYWHTSEPSRILDYPDMVSAFNELGFDSSGLAKEWGKLFTIEPKKLLIIEFNKAYKLTMSALAEQELKYARRKEQSLLSKVKEMQDGLLSRATGGTFVGGDDRYQVLRAELLGATLIRDNVPEFLRENRDLFQFWEFIKHGHSQYAPRRRFLWDSFSPLIDLLENETASPGTSTITGRLQSLSADAVNDAWTKALARRLIDPEGAITAARTLLESVCKHLLDDIGQPYDNKAELPKLYALCATALNLAPDQHTEKTFKTILGNCQSVVGELGSLRNRISDAHGHGRKPIKPAARHAELAVNLAGAVASFLVATWVEKHQPGQTQSRPVDT